MIPSTSTVDPPILEIKSEIMPVVATTFKGAPTVAARSGATSSPAPKPKKMSLRFIFKKPLYLKMRIICKKSMQMRIIRNLFSEQILVIHNPACHGL